MRPAITRDRLRELLNYDQETGLFTAKTTRKAGAAKIGEKVGCYTAKSDAMVIQLDGRVYTLHNLAWLWVHGELPPKQLIKLDGNGKNTAIGNLALPEVTARGDLTQARLISLLSYDLETGVFRWKVRAAKTIQIGSVAGSAESNKHRFICVDRTYYTAQRLAWLYVYGELPDRPLRFLDGDPSNVAISNLALPEHDTRTVEGKNTYQRGYRNRSFSVLRASDLRKDFGISLDVYQQMFVQQKGVCAICKRPERSMRNGKVKWLAVDHCHKTGVVRGLLCEACNTSGGRMEENPVVLRVMADYFEKNHDMVIDGNVIRLIKKGTP